MTATSRLSRVAISIFLVAVPWAFAQSADTTVRVDEAWARRAPMLQGPQGSGTGAAYAKLVNSGTQADALVAAASDVAASVEIHQSYQESGLMKMRAVERIDVAAGQTVELRPGGYHVMFVNLKRDLKAGDTVDVTFRFQKAGAIPVRVVVK